MSKQVLGWSLDVNTPDRGHVSFGTVADNTPREAIFDCSTVDTLSIQARTGGTLAGTIKIFASNSFVPNQSDTMFGSGGGSPTYQTKAVVPGTFIDITSRVTGITNPAGSGGDCMINVAVAGEPFVTPRMIKFQFVQSAGSGAVDIFVSGKSLTR